MGERHRLSRRIKSKLIVAVVASFFIFQLFLFVKSLPAEFNLYLRFLDRLKTSDPFWVSFWFSSELVGEVGLAVRFVGSCFAVAFAWLLFGKGQIVFSHLRKAVLCEGAYYLFNFPFIISLFTRPNTSITNMEAGLSYLLQIAFVSSPFLIFYTKMKKPNLDIAQVYSWVGVAVVGFTFALWVKHFFLNLYALPINLVNPVLLAGLLNSAFTMFFAGLILLIAFLPVIRRKQLNFNSKVVGVGFLLIGLYFLIYVLISLLNQRYLSFLVLTELWAIAFVIPGIGFISEKP